MRNCLVTKLNGVVDNSSLRKFGEARIRVNAGSGSSANLRTLKLSPISGKTITISVIGNIGSFTVNDDLTIYTTYQLSDSNGKTFVFSEESVPYEISITSKYDIYSYTCHFYNPLIETRMSEFLYCSAYIFDAYYSTVGDYNIADILTMPNVVSYSDEKGHCEGDLSALAGRKFTYINLQYSNVTGDINNIASDILNRVQFF